MQSNFKSEALKFKGISQLFSVRTPLFDGPIDLLLHLVKTNELPIAKVALAEVAEQYLNCLDLMRSFDLEVAGEYLVIAATLLSIKSHVLLNDPVELVPDEDGNLHDPYEALLEQLREAAIYQDAASLLGQRSMLGEEVFDAPSLLRYVDAAPRQYQQHDPTVLGKAIARLLQKASERGTCLTIQFDSVSITERMMSVLRHLESSEGPVVFFALIPDISSRISIVATFIALLELCKRGAIKVVQESAADSIFIALTGTEFDFAGLRSDFDLEETGEVKVDGAANA